MMNALMNVTDANLIAESTTDAYSFPVFGMRQWVRCAQHLIHRGYNAQEIDAVLRSKLMRLAGDGRADADRKATAKDLERFLDSMQADTLREYIADVIEGIREERAEQIANRRRATLTLVVSR